MLLASWLPRSPITKRFRQMAAEVVVRYLGGDQSLIDEVRVIGEAHASGSSGDTGQFFAQADEVQRLVSDEE